MAIILLSSSDAGRAVRGGTFVLRRLGIAALTNARLAAKNVGMAIWFPAIGSTEGYQMP